MTISLNSILNARPLHWIVFALILTVGVGLWRSIHRHPFRKNDSTRSSNESGNGWALIGILATGFLFGSLFQIFTGDAIREFVSRWLDEDGQIIAILATSLVVVGGSLAFFVYLSEITDWLTARIRRKK